MGGGGETIKQVNEQANKQYTNHVRAASVGCMPRGYTVTCTVGMAKGWGAGAE